LLAGRLAEVYNSTCTPSDELTETLQASHERTEPG